MTDTVDVLIIGSGASGAAVAWSLAETKMHVVCMEQGDWVNPATFPSNGRDWEARQWGDFSQSPNRRQLPSDYPINDDNSPIKIMNFNAVGGSTLLYHGHYPRFHPSDFRVRSLDGVADDWPIDYWTLEPFYNENDKMMGVSGMAGDPAYPPKQPQMPPLPLGRGGAALGRAMNKLGWHWWPSDTTLATEDYDGRARCINLQHCPFGCAQGAKASTDITYWPRAIRAGVELRPRCRVQEIVSNDGGMATGVVYIDPDGVRRFQAAEVVIIACNGIGTPRLLLNSRSGIFPNGIANSSGLVGRNLMLHPYASVHGYLPEPSDGHRGPAMCIWSQQFYETDAARGFKRGYTWQFGRGMGLISTVLSAMNVGHIPWGEGHHEAHRRLFGHRVGMGAICEDLPEEHNRVTLDDTRTDDSGMPAARVDYALGENTKAMMAFALDRGREVLAAAGASNVASEAPIRTGGWHWMGTARMGRDPERSVVNEWGRCHDVKNLFIVDGSLFVTGAGVNPTSTIQALSLYVADQIKQRLATLFD